MSLNFWNIYPSQLIQWYFLFLIFLKYFFTSYWRIVDLQCHINFCCTANQRYFLKIKAIVHLWQGHHERVLTLCFIDSLSNNLGLPGSSAGKESACNTGNLDSIPGSGRSPGEGNSYPLPYSGLENSMDYAVHGVAKSWTQLSDFQFHTFTFQ